MKVRSLCLWLLSGHLMASFAPAVLAQGLRDVIPKNQKPLSKTFPPSGAEQTPTGVGKFVIFTRESVGKEDEWDFIAGAWECIPSRPDLPVTKRIEFCHSGQNASPLLDTLVMDDSHDRFPRFVSLGVNAGVNLYDIHYRTWDVRCIWQGERLIAFGVMQGTIFCRNGEDWFRLESSTGAIQEGVPFIPLDVDSPYWLVRKPAEKTDEWSYDPVKEQFVARFGVVETEEIRDYQSLLSPDGKNRAWVLVPLPDGWPDGWRGSIVSGTMLLQRDGHDVDIRVPVRMQAVAGRGRPIIPIGTSLRFTNGAVEFTATTDKAGTNDWVWTIEVASGTITESMRRRQPLAESDFAVFDGVPTPAYLREHLRSLTHFGRSGLAPAFLMHLGVIKELPEYPDCTAGVSRDGRHVLYRGREGPLADYFIYVDLQSKQIVRWVCPSAIKRTDFMEFMWVETP